MHPVWWCPLPGALKTYSRPSFYKCGQQPRSNNTGGRLASSRSSADISLCLCTLADSQFHGRDTQAGILLANFARDIRWVVIPSARFFFCDIRGRTKHKNQLRSVCNSWDANFALEYFFVCKLIPFFHRCRPSNRICHFPQKLRSIARSPL